MSKYSVSIKSENGTVEKLLFNNYKEISDKTGLSIGTITRMMNGVTKYHKKETKDKLLKYKIKKLSKTNNINEKDNIDQESVGYNSNENEQNINNNSIEVAKFNRINIDKTNNQIIQNLRKNLYEATNVDYCDTFLEYSVNNTAELIAEVMKKMNEDTICVLICNKRRINGSVEENEEE